MSGRHYHRKLTTHAGKNKPWLPYEDELVTRAFNDGKKDDVIRAVLAAAGYERTLHAIGTRRLVLGLANSQISAGQMKSKADRENPIAQDAKFCAAMRKAIEAGLENPQEWTVRE